MTTLSAHIHGGPHQSQNLYATRFTRRLWNLDDYLQAPPEARARKLEAFMEGDTSSCCPDLQAHLARVADAHAAVKLERLLSLRFPLFDA